MNPTLPTQTKTLENKGEKGYNFFVLDNDTGTYFAMKIEIILERSSLPRKIFKSTHK